MAGLALPENLPTVPILASGHAPVNLMPALRKLRNLSLRAQRGNLVAETSAIAATGLPRRYAPRNDRRQGLEFHDFLGVPNSDLAPAFGYRIPPTLGVNSGSRVNPSEPKRVGLPALPAPTSGRTLGGQSFLLGLRPEKPAVLQLAQYASVLHRCAKTVHQTLWGFPFTWGYVSHSNLQ